VTACLSHCREAPALLMQLCSSAKEGTQLCKNSPARLPDVGLGPRVGLPGRRQPAGYGTSWSVLVSGTSGRPSPSSADLRLPFFPRTSDLREMAWRVKRDQVHEGMHCDGGSSQVSNTKQGRVGMINILLV
jgi:hypothetical protein